MISVTHPLVTLTVLYFAKARDLAGVSEETIEVADSIATLSEFLALLSQRRPGLAGNLERMRVARNESFAELHERPESGDVIALIPPVAGG
jgi:molybdopterin converting factor subunit 1